MHSPEEPPTYRPCHLHDDAPVGVQRRHAGRLAPRAVAAGVVLTLAVQRRAYNHGLADVALQQAAHQAVACAVEGVRLAVAGHSQRRLPVTEVVRAAEDDDGIRVGLHLLHTHTEIAVGRVVGHHALARKARAGNAVVVGLLQAEFAGEHIGVAVFDAACADAEGDAVTEEIDGCSFELHGKRPPEIHKIAGLCAKR